MASSCRLSGEEVPALLDNDDEEDDVEDEPYSLKVTMIMASYRKKKLTVTMSLGWSQHMTMNCFLSTAIISTNLDTLLPNS